MPGCRWQASPLCGRLNAKSKAAHQCFRPFHSHPRVRAYDSVESDHAALIDTSSLRSTLESIREANRTQLIRKVDGHGYNERLSLPKILDLPVKPPSEDAAAIERLERRQRKQNRQGHHGSINRRKTHAAVKYLTPNSKTSNVGAKYCTRNQRFERVRLGGRVATLTERWLPEGVTSETTLRPWMKHLTLDQRAAPVPARERLSCEIQAFEKFISPDSQEQEAADRVVGDLRSILHTMKDGIDLEVVGSRSSGLASPLSDIDVNVLVKGQQRLDTEFGRQDAMNLLKAVTKHLRKSRKPARFSVLLFLRRSKVPIVKLAHIPTGLQVEIQSTNGAFNGLEYAKSFQREYKTLKSLFLVLRHAFRLRGLDIGACGGITSYPLLNMTVASLKSLEARHGSVELADHLLGFLELFSNIDFSKHGLSVIPFKLFDLQGEEGRLFRAVSGSPNQSSTMFLKDPADPSNNLGKTINRIDDVQATIIDMNVSLRHGLAKWDSALDQTTQGPSNATQSMSLLAPLLEAEWRSFHLDRKLLTKSMDLPLI